MNGDGINKFKWNRAGNVARLTADRYIDYKINPVDLFGGKWSKETYTKYWESNFVNEDDG